KYATSGNYTALESTQLRAKLDLVFTELHVFSPRVVNTLSTGGSRDALYYNDEVDGFLPGAGSEIVKKLGLQGVNPQNIVRPGGSPVFRITGYSRIEITPGGFRLADRNFNFADNLSWAVGRHVIKLG